MSRSRRLLFLEDQSRDRQSFVDAVKSCRKLNQTQRRCLDLLLDRIWPPDKPREWKPGAQASVRFAVDDLACDLVRSRSTTNDALAVLKERGLIKSEAVAGGSQQNLYSIVWDAPFRIAGVDLFAEYVPEEKPEASGNENRRAPKPEASNSGGIRKSGSVEEQLNLASDILRDIADFLENSGESEASQEIRALSQMAGEIDLGPETGGLRFSPYIYEWMNEGINKSHSFIPEKQKPEASGNPEAANDEWRLFKWPRHVYPIEFDSKAPETIQELYEAISGVEIEGRSWWGSGPDERLRFFAEAVYSLDRGKSQNVVPGKILTNTVRNRRKRAHKWSKDPFGNRVVSEPYRKAADLIRQLDGICHPCDEPQEAARSTGDLTRNRVSFQATVQAARAGLVRKPQESAR